MAVNSLHLWHARTVLAAALDRFRLLDMPPWLRVLVLGAGGSLALLVTGQPVSLGIYITMVLGLTPRSAHPALPIRSGTRRAIDLGLALAVLVLPFVALRLAGSWHWAGTEAGSSALFLAYEVNVPGGTDVIASLPIALARVAEGIVWAAIYAAIGRYFAGTSRPGLLPLIAVVSAGIAASRLLALEGLAGLLVTAAVAVLLAIAGLTLKRACFPSTLGEARLSRGALSTLRADLLENVARLAGPYLAWNFVLALVLGSAGTGFSWWRFLFAFPELSLVVLLHAMRPLPWTRTVLPASTLGARWAWLPLSAATVRKEVMRVATPLFVLALVTSTVRLIVALTVARDDVLVLVWLSASLLLVLMAGGAMLEPGSLRWLEPGSGSASAPTISRREPARLPRRPPA